MNPRVFIMTALLVSPVWAQEPASFDLGSDSLKKIVHDAASTQFADVRVADKAPAKSAPAEFKYVPPEKPAAPVREPPRQLPVQSPQPDNFVTAVVDILFDEILGTDDIDDITVSNELLRCQVQKDIKTSPPGPDRCPTAY
jgi:hypothetical protein